MDLLSRFFFFIKCKNIIYQNETGQEVDKSYIHMYKSEAKGNMLLFIKNTGRQLPREKTKSITLVS
jgi:hypothetical protein